MKKHPSWQIIARFLIRISSFLHLSVDNQKPSSTEEVVENYLVVHNTAVGIALNAIGGDKCQLN